MRKEERRAKALPCLPCVIVWVFVPVLVIAGIVTFVRG